MQALLTYYAAILAPLAIVYLFFNQDYYLAGVITLFLYGVIYRPFIDSLRLYKRDMISKKQFRKWYIPLGIAWAYPFTHFLQLYTLRKN